MMEPCRVSFRDERLAFRKAEEASQRRFQAAAWLEDMVGPLGLPPQPSEQEFVSCLRSGLVLCNTINKIQPGAVPKVVAFQLPGPSCEVQPLPAFQYFENIRNFLVAADELMLPSFEASDIEKDMVEAGSAAKIVNCVLGLKSYNEWKQRNNGTGPGKIVKSPIVAQPVGRTQSSGVSSGCSVSCKRLDWSSTTQSQSTRQNEQSIREGATEISAVASLINLLSKGFNTKEIMDNKFLDSCCNGAQDTVKLFAEILSSCLEEHQVKPILNDLLLDASKPTTGSPTFQPFKHFNICWRSERCKRWDLLEAQANELLELKAVLARTRMELVTMHSQLQDDLKQLGSQFQELSAAASGYHQAVLENKNLYNMLQELRGNIRVFCRIRPTSNMDAKCAIDYIGSDGSMIVLDPVNPQSTRKMFQFNKVFGPTATQDEVYKETQSLIRSVMDGYNVCIFAYGQTGSGKTHTMCGPSTGLNKDVGVNYRALSDLFHISSAREDVKYDITVQMVEIYNEQVRDLLAEDAKTTKLEIRNCLSNGGFSVPDAHVHHVQSVDDILNLMNLGEKNRIICSTAINHKSSRSHSVVTVHIHGKDITGSTIRSCLHLVDLAGSERVDKSEVTGDRLKEAQHINKSLSCLGDVITALGQKNSHVPYRNSKLTQLLQNSLGGHAKVLMFAHVSPEAGFFGETVSTLKFAQRVSTVELGAAHLNKESSEIRQLKEQIDNLQKSLARKEAERALPSYKMKENRPITDWQPQNGQTPPRSRRLSIENRTVQKFVAASSPGGKMVLKSPCSQPERTPPCSRRSSIEPASSLKTKTTAKADDQVIFMSPISAPRLGVGKSPVRNQRFNIEGSNFEKVKKENTLHSDTREAVTRKDGVLSSEASCDGGPALRACLNCATENACNSYTDHISPHQSQQLRIDRSSLPLQQSRTPISSGKSNETITPYRGGIHDATSIKTSITSSSSRRSQIRKSLQTIGKLINGSEKKSNRCPLDIPSSAVDRNNENADKSPMTADARFRRRQSLTPVQTSEFRLSRRSSLGGRPTDSYSNNIRTGRTPELVLSSTKATTRRWL